VILIEACCLLFKLKETWEEGKKHLLGDMKFLQKYFYFIFFNIRMVEFDVAKVKNRVFKKLNKKYLKKEGFNYNAIKI